MSLVIYFVKKGKKNNYFNFNQIDNFATIMSYRVSEPKFNCVTKTIIYIFLIQLITSLKISLRPNKSKVLIGVHEKNKFYLSAGCTIVQCTTLVFIFNFFRTLTTMANKCMCQRYFPHTLLKFCNKLTSHSNFL